MHDCLRFDRTAQETSAATLERQTKAQQAVNCGEKQSSSHSSDPGAIRSRRVLQQICRCVVRNESAQPCVPRVSMSLHNPPSHASCATAVSDRVNAQNVGVSNRSRHSRGRRFLKELSGAYLYCPSHRSSRCVLATRHPVLRDYAALRDLRSAARRDRVETSHTGRSRLRRVRAAAAGFAELAAVAKLASREDRQGTRGQSAAGGLGYGSDGDPVGA